MSALPPKADIVERIGMSALCQKQTFCAAVKSRFRSPRRRAQRIVFGCSPLLADALTGSGGVEMG